MLIAQITDLHLGFEPGNPRELNQRRFERVVADLRGLDMTPDVLLMTGDLTDKGEPEAYARVREATKDLPFPVFPGVGNHDRRATFLEAWPEFEGEDGFVQYVIDDFPVRIIMLDTLEEGRHSGAFCEKRAAWLDARLSEAPDRPTMIGLHHPPIDTGIAWMGSPPGEAWMVRLTDVIGRHPQVKTVTGGHMHRTMAAPWADSTLIVAPPTAPNLTLTMKPIDYGHPDDRPLVDLGPPGFTVHQWRDGRFVTHFEYVSQRKVLARDSETMHDFVVHLAKERGEI